MTEFTTWRSLVDGEEIGAIPDRDLLHAHYDARELGLNDNDSVTTWDDLEGDNDLTEGDAPTFKTDVINGNPVVRHDGSGNYLETAFASEISQPNHVYAVAVWRDAVDAGGHFWDGDSQDEANFRQGGGNEDWRISAPDTVAGGSTDNDDHIFGIIYDGPDSAIREDGSVVASGDAGSNGYNGFKTGVRGGISDFGQVDFGEILIYNGEPTPADVEQYLSDEWGISLS